MSLLDSCWRLILQHILTFISGTCFILVYDIVLTTCRFLKWSSHYEVFDRNGFRSVNNKCPTWKWTMVKVRNWNDWASVSAIECFPVSTDKDRLMSFINNNNNVGLMWLAFSSSHQHETIYFMCDVHSFCRAQIKDYSEALTWLLRTMLHLNLQTRNPWWRINTAILFVTLTRNLFEVHYHRTQTLPWRDYCKSDILKYGYW